MKIKIFLFSFPYLKTSVESKLFLLINTSLVGALNCCDFKKSGAISWPLKQSHRNCRTVQILTAAVLASHLQSLPGPFPLAIYSGWDLMRYNRATSALSVALPHKPKHRAGKSQALKQM